MATRRMTRTSSNAGLSLRSGRNQNTTKVCGVTKFINPPVKRTRSKTDINPEPQQKRRAVFGDITNKNKEATKPLKKLLKDTKPTLTKNAKVTRSTSKPKTTTSAVCAPASTNTVSAPVQDEPLIIELTQALDLTEKNKSPPEEKVEEPTENVEPEKKPEEDIDFDAFDKEHADQPFWEAEYAKDIFKYYKEQEPRFDVPDYMNTVQTDVTPEMRAILMDWLVEVQTNFELHHETLYLAAKLVDIYLSKIRIRRTILQLVGTAALFIACKYDERILPPCEDFLYVCDNAYSMEKLFDMERKLFVAVGFHLGIPLSYRFLRRYCKVAGISTKTMTLARYILELTLLEYPFCYQRESLKAAGCLWLALRMEHMEWNAMLTHHSGYTDEEAKEMAKKLNQMLLTPHFNPANEIYNKYSHEVFLSVAHIPKLSMDQLEG